MRISSAQTSGIRNWRIMRVGNTTPAALALSITRVHCHVLARQAAVDTSTAPFCDSQSACCAPQPHQQREITSAAAAAQQRERVAEFETSDRDERTKKKKKKKKKEGDTVTLRLETGRKFVR
jgi:hypothetical protein